MLDGSIPVRPTSRHRTEAGQGGQPPRCPRTLPRLARSVARIALAAAVAGLAGGALGPAAAVAQPTLAPAQVLAGPGSDLQLGGLTVARDGSGGVVYLADAGGVAHVFAARLVGGVFQPPAQLDGGMTSPSSQVVITGTNGGVLQVAFINGGNLFVTSTTSTTSGWSAPAVLASAAASPSISMNTYGESYVAFTAAVAGGSDVEIDYYNGSTWTAASPQAVNATPGDDAGNGADRPDIATAGDGVAIVTWGENGHIYSRRVWGTATSVELERLDPSTWAGWSEVAADSPSVAVGGDSSYPDIAFREELASGAETQSRVLVTRLIAEDTQPTAAVDGLSTPGSASADEPQIAMNEYGRGFVSSATDGSDQTIAEPLATNGALGRATVIGTGLVAPYVFPTGQSGLGAPYAVPGIAGLTSTLIAWQQTSAGGGSQIVLRYAQDGHDLADQQVVSPSGSNAAQGLAAAGDVAGDAAVAWVQGSGSAETIDYAQLYQAPGAAVPAATVAYTRNIHPTLSWTPSRAPWGPLTYTVTLDGNVLGQTAGSSLPITQTLIDGPHVWQVQVTNPAGLSTASARSTVFVDTQPPRLRISFSGRARVRRPLTLHVVAIDPANPTEPASAASGIASVTVKWSLRGGAVNDTKLAAVTHTFTSAGLTRVTVTATDKAGNVTTIARYVRILPAA